MKRSCFNAVLIVGCIALSAINIYAEEEKYREGFLGITWGTFISALSDMQPVVCEDHICTYSLDNDELGFGEAVLSKVQYAFYDDMFYEVILEAKVELGQSRVPDIESVNYLAFKEACYKEFGSSTFEATELFGAEHYRWEKTPVRKKLSLSFNSNIMTLTITQSDLYKKLSKTGPEHGILNRIKKSASNSDSTKQASESIPEKEISEDDNVSTQSNQEKEEKSGRSNTFIQSIKNAGSSLWEIFSNEDREIFEGDPHNH